MLLIRNNGEVELAALTLIGATTKSGDSGKIGFFGSGNKYAIATLLKHNVNFQIYAGTREVPISKKTTSLRGVEYDQVIIDDVATSITTRMGPTWELWFAIREFVCNAVDEGGFELTVGDPEPREGTTLIAIEGQEWFLEDIHKYMLWNKEPIAQHEGIKVYEGDGSYRVFRRSINVTPGYMSRRAIYWYDIEDIDINESRVYSSEWQASVAIAGFLAEQATPQQIQAVLDDVDCFEYSCLDDGSPQYSDTWFAMFKDSHLCAESMRDHLCPEDRFCYTYLPDALVTHLGEQFPELRILGRINSSGWEPMENAEKRVFVDKAVEELREWGDYYSITCPVLLGTFKDNNTVAQYDPQSKEIRLALQHTLDDDELRLTLIEEHMHSKGFSDGSRMFEHRLMGLLKEAYDKQEVYRNKVRSSLEGLI